MKDITLFAPRYYKCFACIADKCTDNCCIGWEIDIDDEAYCKYMAVGGAFGERLKKSIALSEDSSHCFRLTADERCPFLNENNLCDIILTLGEDCICEICTMHPRYREWFADRCEIGVGMCCETAAELILGSKDNAIEAVEMCGGDDMTDSELCGRLFLARKDVFEIIANSDISDMLSDMCEYSAKLQNSIDGMSYRFAMTESMLADMLKGIISELEPLNGEWSELADKLRGTNATDNITACMHNPEYALQYRNIAHYYVYRYFMKAASDGDVIGKTVMAALSCMAVSWLYSVIGDIKAAAVMWSKEAEYSEENIELIYECAWNAAKI